MNDFYTFVVISTVNSTYGKLNHQIRFVHTIEAIESIRRKVPDAKILFVDNSNTPIKDEWRDEIEKRVTVFHQMEHNLFSIYANEYKLKSESEVNMMNCAFDLLRTHNLLGKRIFKLSGRYRITDGFDIGLYDNPVFEGKYSFPVTQMASTYNDWNTRRVVMWVQTGLISFDPCLLNEFQSMLPSVLRFLQENESCIEEAFFQFIPHEKVVPLEFAYCQGIKAEGDGLVSY